MSTNEATSGGSGLKAAGLSPLAGRMSVNGTRSERSWVAEGEAEVSEVTTQPGDAIGRELLPLFGITDPADETEFFEQMVRDRRLVIRLRVTHLYGTALDGPVTR
ncbi:pyridoxamine 5'-phosphate oxidase family protein [Thermomonospora echinospora]|uniref:hypothetical protein n=1 Tax=Thermomonospora echinospora TaxID=1992 RepID=UPI00190E6708|nr:hypothetical protein [Thermomonospora echinospora]